MKQIIPATQAASASFEGNSLPKLFHVKSFSQNDKICEFFQMFLDRNV